MRYFLISLTILFAFLSTPLPVLAAGSQFITIVHPIRGKDFFQLEDEKPINNVLRMWQIVQETNLSATWLVRPDALDDSEIVNFLKSLPSNQEVGLFMEVTPTWTKKAQIEYHQNQNWHDAGSVFLTGYEVEERGRLIDAAFETFESSIGYRPSSVGAWWIDAGSLLYMREKY